MYIVKCIKKYLKECKRRKSSMKRCTTACKHTKRTYLWFLGSQNLATLCGVNTHIENVIFFTQADLINPKLYPKARKWRQNKIYNKTAEIGT